MTSSEIRCQPVDDLLINWSKLNQKWQTNEIVNSVLSRGHESNHTQQVAPKRIIPHKTSLKSHLWPQIEREVKFWHCFFFGREGKLGHQAILLNDRKTMVSNSCSKTNSSKVIEKQTLGLKIIVPDPSKLDHWRQNGWPEVKSESTFQISHIYHCASFLWKLSILFWVSGRLK